MKFDDIFVEKASHFDERTIVTSRECFFLHAKSGYIENQQQLASIMYSLGYNPTQKELKVYYESQNGIEITFAKFLDIIYKHKQIENCRIEILNAFKAYETLNKKGKPIKQGSISLKDLKSILLNFGSDKLETNEVEDLLEEMGIPKQDQNNVLHKSIDYHKFVSNLLM